ncbi:MAG: DUF4402 domain-containing protein [Candidatus Wallbacteria bacterium]|nr:DUF4402 domain-containing protein [Candidatus Wallbacteria bacterium]
MFIKITILILILLLTLFSSDILDAETFSVSSSTDFSVEKQPELSITLVGNMVFSPVSVPSTATDIQLLPLAVNTNGNGSAAQFTVSGKPGQCFIVTVQDEATYLTLGTANPILIDRFRLGEGEGGCGDGGERLYISTFRTGGNTIYVGCTLHMAAFQAAGSYTGSNNLLLSYN